MASLLWLLVLIFAATPSDCFTCRHSHFSACTPLSMTSSNNPEVIEEGDDLNHHFNRFRKFRTGPYHAPQIRKILLLSDLHTDYPQNQEWLYNLCTSSSSSSNNNTGGEETASTIDDSQQTMIIVAGDVSHDLEILRWTFQTLKRKFGEVVFTIGNHDLWIDKERTRRKVATKLDADDYDITKCRTSGKGDGCTNSIEKLEKVFQICIEEDVRIGPVEVGSNSSSGGSLLWVIPFLSWHHSSWDTEPPIECWGGIPSARKVVADYRRTVWPTPLSSLDDSVAQFLDGVNDIILDLDGIDTEDTPLLTFSHFLPRVELLPEKRYLTLPTLPSCVGSTFLEARLRLLRKECSQNNDETVNHLHAFGHTHLSWDATIDGVRYVHVPLAYPREWEQRRRSLEIGSMNGKESENRFPVCIWENNTIGKVVDDDSDDGSPPLTPATTTGFPPQWLGGWWSKYYAVMPRQPHRNHVLAPWAANMYRQLPGGEIEDFDHLTVEKRYQLQCPSDWKAGTGNWHER